MLAETATAPELASLLHEGMERLRRGQSIEAAECLRRAVAASPASVEAQFLLAMALRATGELTAAIDAYGVVLTLAPELAEAHFNLGGLWLELGYLETARAALERAVALRPSWAEAHNRLGSALAALGHSAGANAAFEEAALLAPTWPVPCHNLGQLAMAANLPELAVKHLRGAIARDPDAAASHLDLAGQLLSLGRFEEGWREFEWRFGAGGATPKRPGADAPVWDGRALHGEMVVVWIEQGLGDSLQFVRFVPEIAARGGRVWLQAPLSLVRLYQTMPGIDRLVPQGEEVTGFDYQIPLISLARVCGTELHSIPAPVPYLRPLMDLPPRLGPRTAVRRVGIVWASAVGNPAADRRDCPVAEFAPLTQLQGVELYSFQFGERAADLAACPELEIRDLSHLLGDFASTAALAAEMDLILTVDTAMAHLAGALGLPVWTLLSEPADWRWLRDRSNSPWYPTMRLFWQRQAGDWRAVMGEVVAALELLLAR